jgi:hypothetical protein
VGGCAKKCDRIIPFLGHLIQSRPSIFLPLSPSPLPLLPPPRRPLQVPPPVRQLPLIHTLRHHLPSINLANPYPSPSSMGNCASNSQEADGKARSDLIDRQIEEDSKRYKRECKILLLGASTLLDPLLPKNIALLSPYRSLSCSPSPTDAASLPDSRVTGPSVLILLLSALYPRLAGTPLVVIRGQRARVLMRAASSQNDTRLFPSHLSDPHYLRVCMLTLYSSLRFRRVRKVNNSQANEDHSPEWLLSR